MNPLEQLARCRYPWSPLAVELFLYDRGRAGLGALDGSRRRTDGREGYRAIKYFAPELGGKVVYRLAFYRPAGWAADDGDLPVRTGPSTATLTMTRVLQPEIGLAIKHVADAHPARMTQRERTLLAWRLRGVRAELRAAVRAAKARG